MGGSPGGGSEVIPGRRRKKCRKSFMLGKENVLRIGLKKSTRVPLLEERRDQIESDSTGQRGVTGK